MVVEEDGAVDQAAAAAETNPTWAARVGEAGDAASVHPCIYSTFRFIFLLALENNSKIVCGKSTTKEISFL